MILKFGRKIDLAASRVFRVSDGGEDLSVKHRPGCRYWSQYPFSKNKLLGEFNFVCRNFANEPQIRWLISLTILRYIFADSWHGEILSLRSSISGKRNSAGDTLTAQHYGHYWFSTTSLRKSIQYIAPMQCYQVSIWRTLLASISADPSRQAPAPGIQDTPRSHPVRNSYYIYCKSPWNYQYPVPASLHLSVKGYSNRTRSVSSLPNTTLENLVF